LGIAGVSCKRLIAPIAEVDPDAWEDNLAVNILGPFFLVQAALSHLRQYQGRVINVSSGAAVKATPGWSAYCVSKAGINHFTRMMAAEEPEITTVALRPGVVDTEMQATIRQEGGDGMPHAVHDRYIQYYREDELLPPEVPGCALAVLALYAPRAWNGQFLAWDSEQVQSLVRKYACDASP
jgi:NAD(P)-dependent dehydrogenase (short-subunit alcohol dehydrogenase family)